MKTAEKIFPMNLFVTESTVPNLSSEIQQKSLSITEPAQEKKYRQLWSYPNYAIKKGAINPIGLEIPNLSKYPPYKLDANGNPKRSYQPKHLNIK